METTESNGYRLVEIAIKDILRDINPSRDDWAIRFHIIQEIRAVVGSMETLKGATVEPFGSFVSNLFTTEGDLDISVDLQNGQFILCPGRKHKQNLLAELHSVMKKKGVFRRLLLIPNARVPILKFQFNKISCDISINNLVGQMKSIMLYWINDIDGRFRDLTLLVKQWAKAHKINDSKNGSFNSYSLTLLVIFHLQTLVPAILPPLKNIFPTNMSETLVGVRSDAVKHIEDVCAANIKRIKLDRSRRVNRSTLSELFVSFLSKLSHICSQASTKGINLFYGQLEDINSNMSWLPKTYAILIEDPFEQPANTAKAVSSHQLMKVEEAIRETQALLFSSSTNLDSLRRVLVVPQVSWLATPKRLMSSSVQRPSITPVGATTQHRSKKPAGPNNQQNKAPFMKRQQNPPTRNDESRNATTVSTQQAPSGHKVQVWKPRSVSHT